jgi:hypothetical protein
MYGLILVAFSVLPLIVESVSLDGLAKQSKFTLRQVAVNRTRTSKRSVFHNIRSTYWKYGWEIPQNIHDGCEAAELAIANKIAMDEDPTAQAATEPSPKGASGSVVAQSIHGDVEYLIDAKVGSHDLLLDLDTGSSDL